MELEHHHIPQSHHHSRHHQSIAPILPDITVQPPSPRSHPTATSTVVVQNYTKGTSFNKTDENQNCSTVPGRDKITVTNSETSSQSSTFDKVSSSSREEKTCQESGLSSQAECSPTHSDIGVADIATVKTKAAALEQENPKCRESVCIELYVNMKDLSKESTIQPEPVLQNGSVSLTDKGQPMETNHSSRDIDAQHRDYRNHQKQVSIASAKVSSQPSPVTNGYTNHVNFAPPNASVADTSCANGEDEQDNHKNAKASDNDLVVKARNLNVKSSSLTEADYKNRERPTVERRASKKSVKSVNSATANDTDLAYEERREEMMTIRRRSESVLEYKEHAHCRLQEELQLAQEELKLKDDEVKKLARLREQMSEEIEELTASLFEEANKMVQDAHIKRMQAEKLLKEANSKIDMLQAEVTALKTLVITSTPSAPNPHLNPQITNTQDTTNHKKQPTEKFVKGHRRSTSHHNISREISLTELRLPRPGLPGTATCGLENSGNTSQTQREVDPDFFKVFQSWRIKPTLSPQCALLKVLFREDIMPCMAFSNTELAKSVLESVINNTLNIEPVQEKDMYRKCVLTQCNSICKHRVKLKEGESFIFVSHIARNRIASVCDLFTYLRYIVQGLVKSNEKDIYWEVIRLRKQMCLAKLGYVS